MPEPRVVRFRRAYGPAWSDPVVEWTRELGLSSACEVGGWDEVTDRCGDCREVDDRLRPCGCACHRWPESMELPRPPRRSDVAPIV